MQSYALITGANRGIGLELAKCLVATDLHTLAVVRKPSAALETLAGPRLTVIENVELTREDAMSTLKAAVASRPLSLLIANAGILQPNELESLDVPGIRAQFEVNALAPLKLVATLLPNLQAGAKVALITSRMGSMADNTSGGSYGYRMSKAALNAAGTSLAVDLKPRGVAVGLFHPGWVKTDMTGHTGQLDPAEAARLLFARIGELNLNDSGAFIHANGERLPF